MDERIGIGACMYGSKGGWRDGWPMCSLEVVTFIPRPCSGEGVTLINTDKQCFDEVYVAHPE